MYWTLLTLALPLMMWPSHAAPSGTRGSKNALLQTGIKTLMGYRDLPLGEKGVVRDLGGGRVVPRYMLDLYSRFKDQDIVTGGGLANTARSISAEIGLVNGDSMFIFNLTAVDASEQILSSEVHIYRKKRRSDSPLTITLYELAPYYITELGQSKLREGQSGWQVFSVTEAVRSCLATRRPTPHILAIGFSRPKTGGALKRLQLKSFIHHISRPFLLIHSNSNVNITEDHIHARLTDDKNTYIDPESGKTETFRKGTRVSPKQEVKKNNRKTSTKQDNTAATDTTSVEGSTKAQPVTGYKQEVLRRKLALQKKQNEARLKRSIYNNEIPEDPLEPLIPDQKSVNRKQTTKKQKEFSMEDFDFKDQRQQGSKQLQSHLPGSQENRKKRRRKQKTKGVSKKPKSQQGSSRSTSKLASPEEWGLVNYGEEETERQSRDRKVCARRKLVVDFTDIGWSNWVIAPKALESNYCGGSCPYPQSRNLPGLSNHATLQSLVRAVAINPEVPAPCCVPAEMTSLSLLYFDQYDNVVLKNYPNMLVQSCECR